jgi:hypothetical protein
LGVDALAAQPQLIPSIATTTTKANSKHDTTQVKGERERPDANAGLLL